MTELRFGTVLLDLATTGTVARSLLQEYLGGSEAGEDYLTVFAMNQLERTVARVDERKNRRVALIRGLGNQPVDAGIVGGQLWVPNLKSNTVTRIDIRRNRVLETVRVGKGPFVVPDDPSELWVASFTGTDIWRIRPG